MAHWSLSMKTSGPIRFRWVLPGMAVLLLGVSARAQDVGWTHYGADAGGTRYSAARQIDRTKSRG